MKVLTIIIPSYNSESFIKKNMSTFLDDRLYEDVEILLINDGSKDNTAVLAKEYEENYSGYVRFINKDNGGHGSVINRGIQEARGKYIKVVDADDWVDTENLVDLVNTLLITDADVVINPYIKIHQQTGQTLLCGKINGVGNDVFAFDKIIEMNYKITLHAGTYKITLFRDNGILVTEKCFYEDFQYTLYPTPYIKSVQYIDKPVYYYLVGQKTQSVNAYSSLKNIGMYKQVMFDAIDYYHNTIGIISDTQRMYIENSLSDYIRSMYNIYLRNRKEENIQSSMLESDAELKNFNEYFYKLAGKNSLYVRILRSKSKLAFEIISRVFEYYKKMKIFES